jgi:nitrogen-specific signal transduction histidine kinase/ActR/RegA family two-component response regulator
VGTVQDVTERVQLEAQLRQAQKMESIGQLAGGVAHDFNNILTVIQGHASLLMAGPNLEPSQLSALQQVSAAAERAANLTRQLLTFSRKQMMRLRPFDLNETVVNASRMLERILGEDVSLHVYHGSGLPLVQGDAAMLEQVLMNLAVNARDAMQDGGLLIINTGVVEVTPAQARQVADAYAGRFVCLTVSDTGCGIPAMHLPYIFEPFFTTKEVGKGTGLGLATVYGIIKQHRGWVTVSTEEGKGTVFQVYLPVHSGPGPAVQSSSPERASGGRETILVVEDEEPVRNLVRNILERYGYRVLAVSSGIAALQEWPNCRDQVDLVLADIVMPGGVNGRELARRLQEDKPGLKVIYTSGYSSDTMGRDFVVREGVDYLQKPYQPRQLAQVVRACLDGTGRSTPAAAEPGTGR